jgi:hypothetical protein
VTWATSRCSSAISLEVAPQRCSLPHELEDLIVFVCGRERARHRRDCSAEFIGGRRVHEWARSCSEQHRGDCGEAADQGWLGRCHAGGRRLAQMMLPLVSK